MEAAWFESWFNSPYYHILYQHRDDREAELFIDHLYTHLKIVKDHSILDLACGAGRHSIYMATKGNSVTGIDLASNSIEEAKSKAIEKGISEKLHFQVEDMRHFELNTKFDFIFNLFTSFGYFETKAENEAVLHCAKNHLTSSGIIVIDYLNSQLVRANGEERYTKTISGKDFTIHKYFEKDFVIKEIEVNDQGKISKFREQVQLFELEEIQTLLENLGFQVLNHFGDYQLGDYKANSPRSITVSQVIS
jgi:cyclopropane fatty-acyl-phospholipid synthase-like methyltransferase